MQLGAIQYYHSVVAQEQESERASTVAARTSGPMTIPGVHIPKVSDFYLWNVNIGSNNIVESITPTNYPPESAPAPSLLLPSLCHPHVHLDKAFLLTSHLEQYADLAPQDGTFEEALRNTSIAKTRYTDGDLLQRGTQLILESIQAGVTSMRAFVEVDHVTLHRCLKVATELKVRYAHLCHIQICAFAQDPIFSSAHGSENRKLLELALGQYSAVIDCLGTTPYVEDSPENALRNIHWAIENAAVRKLHLDFHLDYNVSPTEPADVWNVLRLLRGAQWTSNNPEKTIALGHCTRETLFSREELARLAFEINDTKLPVSLIGLPPSDIYMQGRADPAATTPYNTPRATLPIPSLTKDYNLNAALGINNLGNAFTPFGRADPLPLASWGVGLYHAGTERDAEILYEAVSTRARRAIGLEAWNADMSLETKVGQSLPFGVMVVKNRRDLDVAGETVKARERRIVRDVVWDVPEVGAREVIRGS